MSKRILIVLVLLLSLNSVSAQNNKTTFGFTIKPSFANDFFRTGPINFADSSIQYSIKQQPGFCAGALVRRTINNSLTFETGLMYVKRKYTLDITDTTFTGKSDFKIVGYEIPASLLIFIQLGKKLYMNTALGASLDVFPSDISTYDASDKYFLMYSARKHKVNAGIVANLGIEYRTKKSGTVYFGFNYHRSFSNIYTTTIEYYPKRVYSSPTSRGRTTLQGDYFALDFRYYFYEDLKRKTKVQGE